MINNKFLRTYDKIIFTWLNALMGDADQCTIETFVDYNKP